MSIQLFIYGFAPIFVYFLVDWWKGFRAGVIAAILVSLLVSVTDYAQTGSIDYFVIGETALIIALGYLSLRMNNESYFKFQPAVVAGVFVLILAYFQWFDTPLLIHYLPRMEQLILAGAGNVEPSAEAQELLMLFKNPAVREMLGRLSAGCIYLFSLHGCIMVYAALKLSTKAWFAWRLAIYPGLLGLVVYYRLTIGA